MRRRSHSGYVQYGCGITAPLTWTNFDVSPTLRLQKVPMVGSLVTRGGPRFPKNVLYGDIVRGLPIAESSCMAIYCSHVLEHLALEDLRMALARTNSYLAPKGTFRFVLPDLRRVADEYVRAADDNAALRFMEETQLGTKRRPRGLGGLLRTWLGNSHHLWMWDYQALAGELQQAGFVSVRRAEFGDNSDPLFRDVEDADRWRGCLGMECRQS